MYLFLPLPSLASLLLGCRVPLEPSVLAASSMAEPLSTLADGPREYGLL